VAAACARAAERSGATHRRAHEPGSGQLTGDADLEPAFAKVALEGAGALCVTAGAFFTSRRDKLVALAAQHRIPTMYPRQEHVAAGGLMSYAPNVAQSYRRAGM